MLHHRSTKGELISKVFRNEEKPPAVDTAEIRRQIRLSKDAGHSKMPTHHATLEKLCDAHDAQHGVKDDWRQMAGKDCGLDD